MTRAKRNISKGKLESFFNSTIAQLGEVVDIVGLTPDEIRNISGSQTRHDSDVVNVAAVVKYVKESPLFLDAKDLVDFLLKNPTISGTYNKDNIKNVIYRMKSNGQLAFVRPSAGLYKFLPAEVLQFLKKSIAANSPIVKDSSTNDKSIPSTLETTVHSNSTAPTSESLPVFERIFDDIKTLKKTVLDEVQGLRSQLAKDVHVLHAQNQARAAVNKNLHNMNDSIREELRANHAQVTQALKVYKEVVGELMTRVSVLERVVEGDVSLKNNDAQGSYNGSQSKN
jgi:hypothetical protein